MASPKTLDISELLSVDDLAKAISDKYLYWEMLRAKKVQDWRELQKYIFAISTSDTSNSVLPWSNKTVTPKLCQIRDNLHANYMAALFPKRKSLFWEGAREQEELKQKKEVVENYMSWVIDRQEYYSTVSKLVYDFIDYGNVFATPDWLNLSAQEGKYGYSGPIPKRISPLDIVFDPTAESFSMAPKIIRSLVSLGEVKRMLLDGQFPTPEDQKNAKKLFDHIMEYREKVAQYNGKLEVKDDIFQVAGFGNYRDYLCSGTVEILTFMGDLYDGKTFYQNKIIKIIDRCTVLSVEDQKSFSGTAPIFHAGWRVRPDSLWAMGPLDNLVSMQYRIDHLENMKADVFDTIAYPPLKIKGQVMDFNWGPMERIIVGDDGDVTMLAPDVNALQADNQIAILEAKMEEMAGSPKEAMGFRTPGEKTAFEVQRLELAAGRIFQNKIAAFERDIIEPLVNAMLELARRYMTATSIRIFDSEMKIATFRTLTAEDLTGSGRLRPVAARHFAEKSQAVQNLSQFLGTAAGQDPAVLVHFSGIELAKMWENLLDLEQFRLVEPFIRITEQGEAARFQNAVQQQVAVETQTPAGIYPGDSDQSLEDLERNALDQELANEVVPGTRPGQI